MGTWSTTEPTNLATGWTQVGNSGEINGWYCTRYHSDGVWNNNWFYFVMKVVGYTARTKQNQACQRIDFYLNDGNTSQALTFYPIATDESGQVDGEAYNNETHTKSLTLLKTWYYTTTSGTTTPDSLTFGVYSQCYSGQGPAVGTVGDTTQVYAKVTGNSPVIKGNICWININGRWKQATPFINVNGTWKQGVGHINISNDWK